MLRSHHHHLRPSTAFFIPIHIDNLAGARIPFAIERSKSCFALILASIEPQPAKLQIQDNGLTRLLCRTTSDAVPNLSDISVSVH